MSRIRLCWLSMGIALFLSSEAAAQNRNYTAFGLGLQSCGHWLSAQRDPLMDVLITYWQGGYMTAVNALNSSHPANGTDIHGLRAWIDNYCSAHPLEAIGKAAEELAI